MRILKRQLPLFLVLVIGVDFLGGGCSAPVATVARAPSAIQIQATLEEVLTLGGKVFTMDDGRCRGWMATPTSDGESEGRLESELVDPEGYVHGIDYEYSVRERQLTISGEGKTPAPGVVIPAERGWGVIGVARMCTRIVPVIHDSDGVYLVGNERWFLSQELCNASEGSATSTHPSARSSGCATSP